MDTVKIYGMIGSIIQVAITQVLVIVKFPMTMMMILPREPGTILKLGHGPACKRMVAPSTGSPFPAVQNHPTHR
jgi:hypothetical protein